MGGSQFLLLFFVCLLEECINSCGTITNLKAMQKKQTIPLRNE
jgi:hypothetical protein